MIRLLNTMEIKLRGFFAWAPLVLTLILLGVKCFVTTLPWVWVLAPLWGTFTILYSILFIGCIVAMIRGY